MVRKRVPKVADIDPQEIMDLQDHLMKTPQELEERVEEADAYAGETPEHFINYVEECIKSSKGSSEDILNMQEKCWRAYCSEIDYAEKEPWQAKIITNKPFQSVKGAISVIRKAFSSPNYLTIEGMKMPNGFDLGPIMKKADDFFLDEQHGNFPLSFTDACEMAFVKGQSMELIPIWEKGVGLRITLVPPEQIWRDPDARSRDPWSGMYWIHEDTMDIYELKQGAKEGIYENIDNLKEGTAKTTDMDKLARRKQMYFKRHAYRKQVLVREFFGVVLDPKGDLLLPNCTFTVAGGEVIRPPADNPYVRVRWPGTSFSPFPHLLRYTGRGLLEGVISLWWMLCNLMNIHVDNLAWFVNKIRELDPSVLADPRDVGEIYPGKILLKKSGQTGNSALKVVEEQGRTMEVLPNLLALGQEYEAGSFVNNFVLGQPGQRKTTKGEAQLRTQQALGLFDSVAQDIESGAVNFMQVTHETILLNWLPGEQPDIMQVLGPRYAKQAMQFNAMPIEARKELLKMNCNIKVSGISAQLKRNDLLEKLQVFSRLAMTPQFSKYVKWPELLHKNADALNEPDPDFLHTLEECKQIDKIEAEMRKRMPQPTPPAKPAKGIVPRQRKTVPKPNQPKLAPLQTPGLAGKNA